MAMGSKMRKVLDEALKLSAKERAEVAGKLLRSLEAEEDEEDPAVVEAAWSEEIARRLKEMEDGTVKGLTRAEAMKIIASDPPKPAR